ncbi:DUF2235 domain-containing protein [Streptomyces netropsis]|uniref:Uncharacterized protein (DUF2235 family) n=1 Tax=Streptomyces netropsis TaxID=55404 RepID=A0A7W7LDK4_STRNE|nr:DUF2235 domain-containing protein [Streptomyces netropsis]MBB4888089.1 uncharacterized protein (DUF2235 family) [Streptomyces netropsis]GGR32115.1 hypothetical protein GCM10010219_41160 [Streptomyces netropsis]
MAKRLIVCCDGTWNLADQLSKTNVTKVALAVRPRAAGVEQRVYYHSGVGTRRWERLRGGAFGMGLSGNVMDAYRFLVGDYEPGDELFLFGFSRGAFTARSLAGLVRNSGILRRENVDRIMDAWALYRDRLEKPSGTASTLFRRTYAHETEIQFIGVWDTVGALGIPLPGAGGTPNNGPWWRKPVDLANRRWGFHDTELSSWVKGAFHALAVDEQRTPFRPTLWHQKPGAAENGQELKQVWFTGSHSQVGGGDKETALSDITLLWMVAQAHRYGLEFDTEALSEAGPCDMTPDRGIDFEVRPDPMGTVHNSRRGPYRLARPWHRPIGQAADDQGRLDGCEYLSETAKDHHDGDAPELTRYLTQGRVRLEPVPLTAPDAHL